VLDGYPALPSKKGHSSPPIFGPCLLWPYGWMHQNTTWYAGRSRPRQHCVRWGPSSPPRGAQPPLFDHVYCGQMARCIKMPLDIEVGLGTGSVMLEGDSAPPTQKGAQPPVFGPSLLWPNGRPSQILLSTCYNGNRLIS